MIIVSDIKLKKYTVQLRRPFVTNLHRQDNAEGIVIAVSAKTETGIIFTGYGEAVPSLKVTGDTLTSIVAVINDIVKPAIVNQTFQTPAEVDEFIHGLIVFNSAARLAVSEAVYDIFASIADLPIAEYLGGTSQPVVTDYTLSISQKNQMLQDADNIVSRGFSALKIKVGGDTIVNEIDKIAQLNHRYQKIHFRIDANQAWTVAQTMQFIEMALTKELPIDFIEQPLKVGFEHQLKALVVKFKIPIMLDESVFNHHQAFQYMHETAVRLINVKLEKAGSITEAQKIFQTVNDFNGQAMIGCMIESKIGIAFAVALANTNKTVKYVDLDAPFMFNYDLVPDGLRLNQTQLIPSNQSGLGIAQRSFDDI
ncbi:dipeptide epimerase [Leuconostoc pseudomesenteroides]|uniref:dipeptide epimerase n=1 Tax=Leuconostoc pseudomesenteroides TaxID=33968 RepID=UPI00289C0D6A|nr:dipeptide epimerase [Leuconostoc pseudomesenteroides]